MSIHSNKYYHLVKALRVQKQQSQVNKALRQRSSQIRIHQEENKKITCQHISNYIDHDNSLEMDDKDKKLTVEFTQDQNQHFQYAGLWVQFQKSSLTFKISEDTMELQKKIAQNKDEKLIQAILSDSESQKLKREEKMMQLSEQLNDQEQEITKLKEKAIQFGLQLQGYQKELVELKVNFDKEEKKINERSSKYKEQKSKDIMIKNIDKQDMQMRKAMASRIKLNQELDFGFQIQRRRAFNQAKQAVNQKKKVGQDKLNKLKLIIAQHIKKSTKIIQQKADLQKKNEILQKQMIYFVKKVIKNFKNHSQGVQWLIKLLQKWKVQIRKQDFPEDISKEDARFIFNLINQLKAKESNLKLRRQLLNQNTTKDSKNDSKSRQYLKTEPNVINHEKPNRTSFQRRKLQTKATVYFDIQNQNDSSFYVSEKPKSQITNFNINTKSLRKIYENAGEVISNMIKNKSMTYNSCKAISYQSAQQSQLQSFTQRNVIEEKIKTKFINIRQKERRNNLKKLLFGEN